MIYDSILILYSNIDQSNSFINDKIRKRNLAFWLYACFRNRNKL